MKNIITDRQTIVIILLTVFLICSGQGTSSAFFGDIIDIIGDAVGDVADAVGDAAGAVVDAAGTVVDAVVDSAKIVADAVKIAAEAVGLVIKVVATVVWHTGSLSDLELFPNGGLIGVVVSELIHIWDPNTEAIITTFTHDVPVRDIAFSPDGSLLASASADNTISLWDVNTETLQNIFQEHTDDVLSVAFSPDGSLLASTSADNTLRLWDPNTQTLLATLTEHTDDVLSVAFSPDGLLLASASADNTLRLWDPYTQTLQATLTEHTNDVLSVAFSPDGLLLASASADNTLRLWDINTQTLQATLDHNSPVLSVAFSPDGNTLATGTEDGTARLWDLQTSKVIATLGHESPVKRLVFSLDGSILHSTTADDKMRHWEITTETGTDTTEAAEEPTEDPEISITAGKDGRSLVIQILDFQSAFLLQSALFPGSLAYHIQWRRKASQDDWQAQCVELQQDTFTLDNLDPDTTYEVRYEFMGFNCIFYSLLRPRTNGPGLSPIAEGTTSSGSDTNDASTNQSEVTHTTSESTIVQIHPASVVSPAVGETLTLSLNITNGEAVAGYQATVQFDTAALRYVSGTNGDFLPAGAFFVEPKVEGNLVKLNAVSLAGESNGDGTLATLTFEVITVKASTLTLSDVLFTDNEGIAYVPSVENAEITEPSGLKGDVNGDGIVNIQDLVLVASNLGETGQNPADVNDDGIVNIQDLVLVAGALGTSAAAPSLFSQSVSALTAAEVKQWLSQAQHLPLKDAASLRGIQFLQDLLAVLSPKETALLSNYPNPFNPETWIPYHLAKDADVTLHIYAVDGHIVRTLALGHQVAGMYQSRSRAAYWDGKNTQGEQVASGVYFYTLRAGDFTATRKMLIRK